MLAPIRDHLRPRDPRSSPLLCAARDRYFSRLSVTVHPNTPRFEDARWIVLEDVNVEYLLDIFTSIDQTRGDIWDTCCHFLEHLIWHKPRQTILGSKIEALPDDHPSKSKCLTRLSWLFQQVVGANRDLGLYEEGIQQAKEALEFFERTNNTIAQAQALDDLARLLFDSNQLDVAEDAASRAINLVPENGHDYLLCRLHRALGRIHQSKGDKDKSIHHFRMALGIASPFNWHTELFWVHYALSDVFSNEDEFEDANVHIERAKAHAINNAYWLGRAMQMQANVWYQQHRLGEAQSEVLRALEVYEKLGAAKDVEYCRDLLQKVEQATNDSSSGELL